MCEESYEKLVSYLYKGVFKFDDKTDVECFDYNCNICYFNVDDSDAENSCTLGEASTFMDNLKEDYPELFL